MGSLTIPGSVSAGTSFASAAAEMQAAADRLGVSIKVQFNEVEMIAVPGGSAEWLESGALARRLNPQPYWNGFYSHTAPSVSDRAAVAEFNAKCEEERAKRRILSASSQQPEDR